MPETPEWLWPLLIIGGPIVLGLAILYALITTHRRRHDRAAQRGTDEAIRQRYDDDRS